MRARIAIPRSLRHSTVPQTDYRSRTYVGHGLSYTAFKFSALTVNNDTHSVSVSVTNIGPMDGAAVPQLYVSYPTTAAEPPMQLKGYAKLFVPKGKSLLWTTVVRDTAVWSVEQHKYVNVSGEFKVCVGASVADLRVCEWMRA